MRVRAAEVGDAEAIVGLINEAFEVERFFLDNDRTNLDEVQAWFQTGRFLVVDEHDELIGCVYIENRGQRAYLGLLSISPSRQKSGLGSCLLRAAEEDSTRRGCRFVDLRIVNLREELPAFYRRHGYQETGTDPFTPDVPVKIPCHFVNMTKGIGDRD